MLGEITCDECRNDVPLTEMPNGALLCDTCIEAANERAYDRASEERGEAYAPGPDPYATDFGRHYA